MDRLLVVTLILILLCLSPGSVGSPQVVKASTGNFAGQSADGADSTITSESGQNATAAPQQAEASGNKSGRELAQAQPVTAKSWYNRVINSKAFFPVVLATLMLVLSVTLVLWHKKRIVKWLRVWRSDYDEVGARPYKDQKRDAYRHTVEEPEVGRESPAPAEDDSKAPKETPPDEKDVSEPISRFETSFDGEMRRVQNNIEDLRRELRINQERIETLATESAAVAERLHPKSIMETFRSIYEADCRARLVAMFDQGALDFELGDGEREDIAQKQISLGRILESLTEINKKLLASPQIDRNRTQSDLLDLDRQIQSYQERSASVRTATAELPMPLDFKNPQFAKFEEYFLCSKSSPNTAAAGYLSFLGDEYKQHMDKARAEIQRQMGDVRSASETSDQSIQEFVRRDLMNIIDTIDAIVKKSTGTYRSHVVDDEIKDICELLGVSEIDAIVGELYAAHFHQPIKRERGGFSKDSITEVHARGFIKEDGQIIRKTRVTIAE